MKFEELVDLSLRLELDSVPRPGREKRKLDRVWENRRGMFQDADWKRLEGQFGLAGGCRVPEDPMVIVAGLYRLEDLCRCL